MIEKTNQQTDLDSLKGIARDLRLDILDMTTRNPDCTLFSRHLKLSSN